VQTQYTDIIFLNIYFL